MSTPPQPPPPPFQPEPDEFPEEFAFSHPSRAVERYSPRPAPARSAGIAAVLSFVLPGAGQLYNGQAGKGILFIVLFVIAVFLCMTIILALIGLPMMYGVAGWAIYDAATLPEYPRPRHGRRY